jgi:glycosyltransferase involved in cell wall biosynthesis
MNLGGTARYVEELVANIPNSALATGKVQGAEIEALTLPEEYVYRIPHLGRRISIVSDLRAWKELRNLIQEINPSVIHTHTFKAGLIGRLVGNDVKHVHTFHGHLFKDSSFSPFGKWLITNTEKFLAKRTDVLISVGEKVGVELRAVGIGKNQSWQSISPGVEELPPRPRTDARTLLNMEQESFFVGWMARMAVVKDPFLLLDIAEQLPGVNFVMAGGGELLDKVVEKAPPNVAVIGWTDSAIFWSAVDCAISTSDNEGMPIALIEAQLAGIPVVATDVGSNSEVVENGVTGLVVEKDLQLLVRALTGLIKDPTEFKRMAQKSKSLAKLKFNKKLMVQKHERIYIELKKLAR